MFFLSCGTGEISQWSSKPWKEDEYRLKLQAVIQLMFYAWYVQLAEHSKPLSDYTRECKNDLLGCCLCTFYLGS